MTDLDDFTADAIRARTAAATGDCQRCGLTPDRDCYMPASRCPRGAQRDAQRDDNEGDVG